MDTTSLFLNVILGSLGMGYVVYGRKQKHGIALLSGVILCGVPWVISNNLLLAAVGVGAAILPFLIGY